jgi:hypothetical protein
MNRRLIILVAFLCMGLFGCATGEESILFVTKTSIAVDVDTNPPTFDVGYGRYEGSIAPVVEDGQVLPLLSSISSDAGISSSVFGSGVAQNFGVGNAAIIMSQYLGSPSNPAEDSRSDFASIIGTPANVNGTTSNGRRYFFGTKTTFGFTTSFAAERGYSPDSISLGYKRKEFAYVPIRQNGNTGSETLSIPSMLATAGTSSSAGVNKSGFSVSQFYATGQAANYLAAHPIIRNSVISKIIGDEEVADKLEKAEQAAIEEFDVISIKGELTTLRASNLIDSLPASDLDGALQSMKDAGIADSDDAFRDADGDGTISEAEKRERLKRLSQPFNDKEMVAKIEQWVSENT